MVDRCAALALPRDAALPKDWPLPQLAIPAEEIRVWKERLGLNDPSQRASRPGARGGGAVEALVVLRRGSQTSGRPGLFGLDHGRADGARDGGRRSPLKTRRRIKDLTGNDLRQAILALAAADAVLSNDSGLLHVAAAIGTPTVGIFGPTSPWHWAPLNPIAEVIETTTEVSCRPCHKPVCRYGHHRCMRDIGAERVVKAVIRAMG